jgi:hypothetical protein
MINEIFEKVQNILELKFNSAQFAKNSRINEAFINVSIFFLLTFLLTSDSI